MGRNLSSAISGSEVLVPIKHFNGTKFGNGNVEYFYLSGTFIVPTGVTTARVRVFGAGAGGSRHTSSGDASGGAGGGFAIKTITGLTSGQSISVTVGVGGLSATTDNTNGGVGGTSSFGAYVSATGGQGGCVWNGSIYETRNGGTGVGGDINITGGDSVAVGGPFGGSGGSGGGNIFGKGSNNVSDSGGLSGTSGSGGSYVQYVGVTPNGGSGLSYLASSGGREESTYSVIGLPPFAIFGDSLPLDYIGTGCGGNGYNYGKLPTNGINGGGGGGGWATGGQGGFPSGGAGGCVGSVVRQSKGGNGLVIIEY